MSDQPIVMRACYTDLKIVRTRKVAQLVFEVPLEQLETWVRLFGAPVPDSEKWVAIARLAENRALTKSEKAKRAYDDRPPNEQAVTRAVMLCKDDLFQEWVTKRAGMRMTAGDLKADREELARSALSHLLGVESRREIASNPDALQRFAEIEAEYRTYTGS